LIWNSYQLIFDFLQTLVTIISALIDKNVNIKCKIVKKDYVCDEELNSLKCQLKRVDDLTIKMSKLIQE